MYVIASLVKSKYQTFSISLSISIFLKNLKFSVDSINEMMLDLYKNRSLKPKDVALNWINENEDIVRKWLKGVKTADGQSDASKYIISPHTN